MFTRSRFKFQMMIHKNSQGPVEGGKNHCIKEDNTLLTLSTKAVSFLT